MKLSKIVSLCLLILFCATVTACGENKGYTEYSFDNTGTVLESGTVCKKQSYELDWDSERGTVILKNTENGTYFSTSPQGVLNNDYKLSGKKNNPKTESAVAVTYFDKTSYSEKTVYSYNGSITKNNFSAKKTKNGVSVKYGFKSEDFSVTVDYILNESNLTISIDTSKIKESKEKLVTKISVAPFLCSKQNSDDDSYLFVPSGSGAIIKKTNKLSSPMTIEEKVYGKDYTIFEVSEFSKKESVRMPVFGSVNNSGGICAIITSGAEASSITSFTNDKNIGYSSVYASFLTRGMDYIETPSDFIGATGQIYSEPIKNEIYSVSYYPFYGENSSYVDIADIYRDYLNKEYKLGSYKSSAKETIVNLNYLGGTEYEKNFLGIPYRDIFEITDLKSVEAITSKIYKITGDDINIALFGYSENGLSIGEIAGGIKINSKLASKSEMKTFFEKCKNQGISAFLNFDTIKMNDSSNGFSLRSDTAVTVNGKRASVTYKSIWGGVADNNYSAYRLLSRKGLDKVNGKLLKYFNKNGFTGISLDTLTSMSYSDYKNENTYACLNMGSQVRKILSDYRQSGISVLSSEANDYAALNSDYILDVPTSSSDYNAYDTSVPFYEIVFKGYIPMACGRINLAADNTSAVLNCIETGVSLSYSIGKNYNNELTNSENRGIYAFDSNYVISELQKHKNSGLLDDIAKLKNAKIISHMLISNQVRETVYDNGITAYVNYGNSDYTYKNIIIGAKNYLLKEAD